MSSNEAARGPRCATPCDRFKCAACGACSDYRTFESRVERDGMVRHYCAPGEEVACASGDEMSHLRDRYVRREMFDSSEHHRKKVELRVAELEDVLRNLLRAVPPLPFQAYGDAQAVLGDATSIGQPIGHPIGQTPPVANREAPGVRSRSVLRREAAQRGETPPDLSGYVVPRPEKAAARDSSFAGTIEKIVDAVEIARPSGAAIDGPEFRERVGKALREFHAAYRTETAKAGPAKLPNGWPAPTFVHLSEAGGVLIEWLDNERSVSFYGAFDGEPSIAIRTTSDGVQTDVEGDASAKAVAKWLEGSPTGGTST